MLSICIPVYNQDLRPLVGQLRGQLQGRPIEILLLDDGSTVAVREELTSLGKIPEVRVLFNDGNRGRAFSRNRLASEARFPWLVFLDDDSVLLDDLFLSRYLDCVAEAQPTSTCVYGGTVYPPLPPSGCELHWQYGREREALRVDKRKESPYLSFKTNNFLISQSLLIDHPFDGSLTLYGHEDTLLAIELEKAGIEITHIENPVLHEGLHTDELFLERVGESIQHLSLLEKNNKLTNATRLQKTANKFKKMGLTTLLYPWLIKNQGKWHRRLLVGYNPRLLMLYKWAILERSRKSLRS